MIAALVRSRPALCLLLALCGAFVYVNGSSPHFGFRTEISLNRLVVAENRSPEHGFLGFYHRFLNDAGETRYAPYNRFPIAGSLILKAVILPFSGDFATQFQAARLLMLAFFAAAVLVAYLALERLTGGQWVAFAAALLAFSSYYSLRYADMIATDGSMDLFAVMLTFHALVVFVLEGRFGQLLAKTCAAALVGWHVFALLLPFIVLGMAADWLRGDGGVLRRARRLLCSRHVVLGAVALTVGVSNLTLNLGLEYNAQAAPSSPPQDVQLRPSGAGLGTWHPVYEDDAPRTGAKQRGRVLPSLASASRRLGWDVDFVAERAETVGWLPTVAALLARTARASLPYAAERAARQLLGASGTRNRASADDDGTRSMRLRQPGASAKDKGRPQAHKAFSGSRLAAGLLGTLVAAAAAVCVAAGRHRILMATLASFGLLWGLLVRGSVAIHSYEGMFLIGVPLVVFSTLLARTQALLPRHLAGRWIAGCAGIAVALFAWSGLQIGRTAEVDRFKDRLADVEAVHDALPQDALVIVHTIPQEELRSLALGGVLLASLNGRHRHRADFLLSRTRRRDGAGLLTPGNRLAFLYDRASYDAGYATLGDPVVERGQGWQAHLVGNRLLFTSGEDCQARQGYEHEPPFFVEVFPAANALRLAIASPTRFRSEFSFASSRFEAGGLCIAELDHPGFDLDWVRVGQFVPGEGAIWSETLSRDWARRPGRATTP